MKTPKCYHRHPETNRDNAFLSKHTFKGSLIRHVAVERAFCFAAKPASLIWRVLHSNRLYRLMKVPFEIVFGLNMNLPAKDVLQWSLIHYPKQDFSV